MTLALGSRPIRLGLLLFALAYCALLVAQALTTEPYIDESMYSMSSRNLVENGSFGLPVIEADGYTIMPGWTKKVTGVRQHSFLFMPLPVIVQAAWYRIFGYSLLTLRMFAVFWALASLVASYYLIKTLLDPGTAILAVLLIATDHVFLPRATLGRMDTMSFCLAITALAFYVVWRERNLSLAICVSQACVVASGLSHPNAGLLSLLGTGFLVLYFDRRRINWKHLLWAALPYVIGGCAMAGYIAVSPEDFRSQFLGNSHGRLAMLSPDSLLREITLRYLGLQSLSVSELKHNAVNLIIVLAYAAAVGYALATRGFRQHSGRLCLLGLTGLYVVGLMVIDNYKSPWYLIYIDPLLAAVTAAAVIYAWNRMPRAIPLAVVGITIALPLLMSLRLVVHNSYRNRYLPVVHWLQERCPPGCLVMGVDTLEFSFGIGDTLLDDPRLGYDTGKRPDFIVEDQHYLDDFEIFQRSEPDVYRHIQQMLKQDYRPEFSTASYTVYAKRR